MSFRFVVRGTAHRRAKKDQKLGLTTWTPPSALSPGERLHELVHETLRGSVMASVPFYDQAKIVALLDSLPALSDEARTAFDPILMFLLSACSLHERYKL
jgi:asparagine synthase (glutamine-hydrolysing)